MRGAAYLMLFSVACTHAAAQSYEIIKEEIRIPRGQTRSFEFGNIPQKDHTILLDIIARLDADSLGGSMYFMKLVLNGRLVRAAKSRDAVRLVNRPLVSPITPNLSYSWCDGTAWRILYAPDFEAARKQTFYIGNPYQTVLDVTDLINPAAENRLEITNTCAYAPPANAKGNYDLVIKAITVHVKEGASPLLTATTEDEPVINRGTPGAGPAPYKGRLMPGGGFTLTVGRQTFAFEAAYSYPRAGFNRLIASATPASDRQPDWRLRVQPTATGGIVYGEGPDYRLQRTIQFTARKIIVTEHLLNKHRDEKLGLIVEQAVNLAGKAAKVRLAGNPDPAINAYYAPGNPSVYISQAGLGLGMICEDDIFRNQATLFYDSERTAAGLRTEYLCLAPRGSVTLEWAIYPVASPDYYDFINLVRQDWGSNYTVKGAWTFFDPDTIIATPLEEIQKNFRRLGITRACSWGGWIDRKKDPTHIGFGVGVFDDYWTDYRARLRQAAEKIRQAVPECQIYIYYDTQRDTSEGSQERFRDSWLTNREGQQLTTEWGGQYSRTYSVVATTENSFGQAMLALVDRYLQELRADGLYWDEMENVAFGAPLITYNMWDGYSCELDPQTYAIARECAITTIIGESLRLSVIKRVRERGGDVMGNGPTCTKDILALKPQRMIEIQHNDYWHYEGNLDTPLGYASSRLDFGNWIRALQMATLLVGTRYNYPYEFSRYVFPFTPIELHAGYLLGQERILTIHDGRYGWPNERCLVQGHYFDKEGQLVARDVVTEIGTEARTAVEVNEGEAAVLIRLPAILTPLRGLARVRNTVYGQEGLRFSLEASAGARLKVHSGEFAFGAQSPLQARLNGRQLPVTVDEAGVAHVIIPPTPQAQLFVLTRG